MPRLSVLLIVCCLSLSSIALAQTSDIQALQQEAEQGDARAQYLLGSAYREGKGVLQDYKEAATWYRKAVDQDFVVAIKALALCYEYGRGVPKDQVKAVELYIQAWMLADEQEAEYVANTLEQTFLPLGGSKDYVQGYAWVNIQAITSEDSRDYRDRVSRKMTPEQIDKGQKLSRELMAKRKQVQAEKAKNQVAPPALKKETVPASGGTVSE